MSVHPTKGSSVARSLKLSNMTSVSTWMGDRHGSPNNVNFRSCEP